MKNKPGQSAQSNQPVQPNQSNQPGEQTDLSNTLTVMSYTEKGCRLIPADHWPNLDTRPGEKLWLDFSAIPDEKVMTVLQDDYGIHPVALRSLSDVNRLPRMQEFGDHILLGARTVINTADSSHDFGQAKNESSKPMNQPSKAPDYQAVFLGIILNDRFLLTMHEQPTAIIERTRERLKANASQVWDHNPDQLLYLILDSLADDCFETIDQLAETIDDIDARATEKMDRNLQNDILDCKRKLLLIHKSISPLRDALLNLRRGDSTLICEHTELYLRDVFDHVLQLLDTTETYREVLSNTTELIMSATNNRLNEIMTVLTIITSFFIPLSFISGFYGMNLVMPEALQPVTYPIVIGVMIATVTTMVIFLRHKKWL